MRTIPSKSLKPHTDLFINIVVHAVVDEICVAGRRELYEIGHVSKRWWDL